MFLCGTGGPNSSSLGSDAESATQNFAEEEHTKFQLRFEEGYDLTNDKRYNSWKLLYHPEECKCVYDINFVGVCMRSCVRVCVRVHVYVCINQCHW